MTVNELKKALQAQLDDELIRDILGETDENIKRVFSLLEKADFQVQKIFSTPGRTELGGNHTDHNLGKVLCAAVQKDTLAAVSSRSDDIIEVRSEGYPQKFRISVKELDLIPSETGTTTSLIRGVLAGIKNAGGTVGGFNAEITSNVGIGSGLSSSASFEVLMGTIINDLYNNNEIPQPHIARIGQFAENQYFGKPCGLMDQTACAVGSILKIDFADPHNINIWKINTNMEASDFVLLVVDTGGSHADLTSAYSSIPAEMKAVAGELGSQVLRDQSPDILMDSISAVRTKLGDRAALRALHYFSENKRVDKMVSALESGDFAAYLKQVSASGLSSQNILQNVIPPGNQGKNQNYALALGLSQLFIEEKGRGVVRVHGGGYAGTVQAYIHRGDFDEYKLQLESIFGGNAVERLIIRHQGSRSILQLN